MDDEQLRKDMITEIRTHSKTVDIEYLEGLKTDALINWTHPNYRTEFDRRLSQLKWIEYAKK